MSAIIAWHSRNSKNNNIMLNKKYIMALNIKPLSDRVLIEPVAAETKLSIFYSRHSQEETTKGNCCCC
jgi:hypothetical protein